MGFSEGTEDEFLLTCFVCKEPFGMLAAFCGGCGSRRDQAMGVERAKSSQQISNNVISTPSFADTFAQTFGTSTEGASTGGATKVAREKSTVANPFDFDSISAQFGDGAKAEKTERVKKPKKKSVKRQIFFSNIRLRIEAINNWQSRRAIPLNILGFFLFIGATYVFTQSFIVGTSNAEAAAEKYVIQAVSHDPAYFSMNNEGSGADKHPIFPVKYLQSQNSTDWLYKTKIHGISGTAEVSVTPVNTELDQTPITIKMKATYTKTLGIFRTPVWAPEGKAATVTIKYPESSNTLIYINGYAAGYVGNPAVKEGTYFIHPGLLSIKFYYKGDETSDSYDLFIQPSGSY